MAFDVILWHRLDIQELYTDCYDFVHINRVTWCQTSALPWTFVCIYGVDGRIILKWILVSWDRGEGGTDWNDLAQDRDSWLAVVDAVMNLQVS